MRPFIHVNCAISADGKLAGPDRKQVRISSDEDMVRVKTLRRSYDAILVGVGTVIADDPHLTVKGLSFEDNPIRIVIDPKGRTPDSASVIDDRAPTIIITSSLCNREWKDVSILKSENENIDLAQCMEILGEFGIENILVEGGGETIASFFKAGLVDRYTVFVGGMIIGGRTSPTAADGNGWINGDGIKLKLISSEILGNGVLMTFEPTERVR